MRVGLIACSKRKLDHAAPAQDLYTGPIFKLAKEWITKRTGPHGPCSEWAILSAKYGLVMPYHVLEPYDLCLADLPEGEKKKWAERVHRQLMDRWGANTIYMILAGAEYRAAVSQMKMVEDVIACWTKWRRYRGMTGRRAAIGIGVLKKLLKENTGYY